MNEKNLTLLGRLTFRDILDAIPADIAVFDKNHRYVFVNKNAIKNDVLREWIIGKTDFDYCAEFNKPISIAEERRTVFNEAVEKGASSLEEKVLRENGEQYHLRHMVAVYDEFNKLEYVIGYGINITSVKKTELDLEEAKRLSVIGEFAAGIAHEINNPLAVIMAKSQLLELQLAQLKNFDKDIKERVDQSLSAIKETSFFTAELITNLKLFSSKADFEHLEYAFFEDTLSIALKLVRRRCESAGIKIHLAINPELKIRCNEVALAQVIMNLITNSLDAVSDLEERWIKIDTQIVDGVLKINFTDSGLGIPDEISTKIMQPFFTTKDPGSGTGLGLIICAKSIAKMGGQFYYNRRAANTQFVIEFQAFEI